MAVQSFCGSRWVASQNGFYWNLDTITWCAQAPLAWTPRLMAIRRNFQSFYTKVPERVAKIKMTKNSHFEYLNVSSKNAWFLCFYGLIFCPSTKCGHRIQSSKFKCYRMSVFHKVFQLRYITVNLWKGNKINGNLLTFFSYFLEEENSKRIGGEKGCSHCNGSRGGRTKSNGFKQAVKRKNKRLICVHVGPRLASASIWPY